MLIYELLKIPGLNAMIRKHQKYIVEERMCTSQLN